MRKGKFYDIVEFCCVCYAACFVTKIVIHGFKFKVDYLIDSVFITIGGLITWRICLYIQDVKTRKNIKKIE